jgi:hypothetical protein
MPKYIVGVKTGDSITEHEVMADSYSTEAYRESYRFYTKEYDRSSKFLWITQCETVFTIVAEFRSEHVVYIKPVDTSC